MKGSNLAYFVQSYFLSYLIAQRGYGANTIASYRDTFRLLFIFLKSRCHRIQKLAIADIDHKCILQFLQWLETERNNAVTTRNVRLANKLTRVGINYILNKYVNIVRQQSPELIPITVTPHVVRHSKTTHLLSAGVNLIYIRDLLGHSSVITTEIYATANPEFLRRAIEKSSIRTTTKTIGDYNTSTARDLTEFLKQYRC